MAAPLYSVVGTCKQFGIDPVAYLREALPALFTLGDAPAGEKLMGWIPDQWLLCRAGGHRVNKRQPADRTRHTAAPPHRLQG